MNLRPLQPLYNPHSQRDEDRFILDFVARNSLLDTLLRRLRAAGSDTLGVHSVLIGSRGMGKTTLLRRIAIAVERDPILSEQFVALNFREEQYNVLTLGDFWRNCGESLAEWAEAAGREDLAQRLDVALPGETWASDDGAGAQFSIEMATLGKRAVLLVDNLDLILDTLSSKSNWAMRRRLQATGGPIVIGASTHALTQTTDREAAFYEFFQSVHLEPLTALETEQCMRALALRGGEHGSNVLRILDTQPERLTTLHRLTGGNPRVLALIYRLLGTGESDAAMADLELLLDQVTPYYKAKVEEYRTPQQRAVIDAIALHWDPVTTGDLAHLTKIPATTLSPLLIRLRKDGLLEQVNLSGAYGGHQLVERFLNVWYLMRHGTRRTKQKMRWLVAFLTSFYSLTELNEIAGRTSNRASWHRDYRLAFDEALKQQASYVKSSLLPSTRPSKTQPATALEMDSGDDLEIISSMSQSTMIPSSSLEAVRFPATNYNAQNLIDEARTILDKAWKLTLAGDAAAISLYDSVLALCRAAPNTELREEFISTLEGKARIFAELGDHDAAIGVLDDIVARFTDASESAQRAAAARAMFNKGITLGHMGNPAAEIAIYDDLLARFADATELSLLEPVARALFNKAITLSYLNNLPAAIAVYDDLLARFADATELTLREHVAGALINKAVVLNQIGDPMAEIAIYNDLLARFADATELTLREQVARALINKAVVLHQMGDPAAEIAIYNDLIARFADATELTLRERVARVLLNKGISLGQMGDPAAEIAVYDDLLTRFANAPELSLRERVAGAMINKAVALGQTGNVAAEIAVYDDLLARFADAPEISLREEVAGMMGNKAIALGQMGDPAAAVAVCDDLIARFSDATELGLREHVAGAMSSKAVALGQMGDLAAKIAVYDDLIARFSDATELSLRERVAEALTNKAISLGQAGDPAAAVAVCDDLIARFADATELSLREIVAGAMINKAISLDLAGDLAAAIAVCDDLLARFADATELSLREQVARAMINKAINLGQAGDPAAAIAVCDDLLARFADATELSLREQVARAMINKAINLGQAGDPAAAIAIYDDLLARFADATELSLREQVARAMINKAINLRQVGDHAAAIAIYDDLLALLADAPEPSLHRVVTTAMIGKATALHATGEVQAASDAFEYLLQRSADTISAVTEINLADIRIRLANILMDYNGDLIRSEALYKEAGLTKSLLAKANLAWLFLLAGRSPEAHRTLDDLNDLPESGLDLLKAGIELSDDNLGSATNRLKDALDRGLDLVGGNFEDDLERLLRLAHNKGHGEHLLTWFEQSSYAEKLAPIYVAFKAYVRGAALLRDVNPEVRHPAQVIYDRLDAPRRHAAASETKKPKPTRKTTRRRKA